MGINKGLIFWTMLLKSSADTILILWGLTITLVAETNLQSSPEVSSCNKITIHFLKHQNHLPILQLTKIT